jgi:hypothetical protein
MNKYTKTTCLQLLHFSIYFIVCISTSFAQEKNSDAIKIYKTLIVETVYPYSVTKILPAEKITLNFDKPINLFQEPQDAIRAHFSAIKALDFERFLNTWDKTSKKLILDKNLINKKDSNYWKDLWRDTNIGSNLSLLHRIEYGSYVIYQYQIEIQGGKLFSDSVALIRENDGWLLTQALANDPILMNWNNSLGRIQIAPLTLLNK